MHDDTTTCVQNETDLYLIAETEIKEFMLKLEPTASKPIYYLLCVALEALVASEDSRLSEHGHYLLEALKTAHQLLAYQGFIAIIAAAAVQGGDRLQAAIRTVSYALQLVPMIPSDEETTTLTETVRYRASERRALAHVAERRKSAESSCATRTEH
jgi:hypothetical protein